MGLREGLNRGFERAFKPGAALGAVVGILQWITGPFPAGAAAILIDAIAFGVLVGVAGAAVGVVVTIIKGDQVWENARLADQRRLTRPPVVVPQAAKDAARGALIVFAAAAVIAVVVGTVWSLMPPRPVRVLVQFTGAVSGTHFRVMANGKPVPGSESRATASGTALDVPVHRAVVTVTAGDKITGEAQLPCGWRPLAQEPRTVHDNFFRRSGTVVGPMAFAVYRAAADDPQIAIDNRDGAARELSIGQMTIALPRTAAIISVPLERCSGANVVKIDGRDAGALASPADLIDTSGRRCYRFAEREYSDFPYALRRLNDDTLAPAVLHPLGRPIDYLFREAPKTISVRAGEVAVSKYELIDAACDSGR